LFSNKGNSQNLEQSKKIKVLNIGVFHMGNTSDASSTEYDEKNKKSKKEIKEVTEAIAKFKPTIILVEGTPKHQESLEKAYEKYLNNVKAKTGYENNEIQLLGFEVGRLANSKRIYGVDHRMGYNYNLNKLAKKLNATKFFKMAQGMEELGKSVDTDVEKIGLKKALLLLNTNKAYNFLININADMLMYVNSKDNFEGADEAAKFYKRNIRMFANINKIPMKDNDRVLIISGATHASFFNKFMSRSLIYDLVPLSKYLK
jgi:hypothetical protein